MKTIEKIVDAAEWEFDGRQYMATITYTKNGVLSSLSRRGVVQLPVYGLMRDYLINLSKSGAVIEHIQKS